MGVLKNDVGRPSNKTIAIRRILMGIVLLVIIGLVLLLCYHYKENEQTTIDNKVVELDIDSDQVVDLFNKYNIYTSWIDIVAIDNTNPEYNEKYQEEGNDSFSYFYDKEKIENVSDNMKFALSIGNLYIKKSISESDYNYLDLSDNEEIYLDVINRKSLELFGSKIIINNIVDNNNKVYIGISGKSFEYIPETKTFKVHESGIGDSTIVDYYTKIISAKKYGDKIVITNKLMYLICSADEVGCNIDSTMENLYNLQNTIDNVDFDLSEAEKLNLIDKYSEKLNTYEWTFTKDKDGNYIFKSIEKIK